MLKNFLQSITATAIALMLTPFLVTGFKFDNNIETTIVAAVVLVLVNFFVKPIVTLISFPINVITLGFFSLLMNSIMLLLTSYLVSGIEIGSGLFHFDYFGLAIPDITLSSPYLTLFAAATCTSLITWILRKVLL